MLPKSNWFEVRLKNPLNKYHGNYIKIIPIIKKTGLSENESQEFIEIVFSTISINLATKDDLKNLATKEDLHNLAVSTKDDLKNAEIRLTKWVKGLLFAQTGIIIAIIKLFWKTTLTTPPAKDSSCPKTVIE